MKTIQNSIYCIFILIACAALPALAQTEPQTSAATRGNTSFGIKGGANLSNLYVDEVSDENAKFGFQAGFFMKAGVTKNFAIQPELIYSQKGAQETYDNIFATGKASIALHYVELPVMAVINFGAFNIHAGPYISYLAGVTVKNKTDNGSDFKKEIDKDNFESFDYGVAGGIGADGSSGLGFGIRYNYGLKEVGKERTFFGQPYRFPNAKNSVLQAYLTIAL